MTGKKSLVLLLIFVAATIAMLHTWTGEDWDASVGYVTLATIWVTGLTLLAVLSLNRMPNSCGTVVLALFLLVCGVGCAGVLPALASAIKAERNRMCSDNLRQIGVGLLEYHQANEHFPPVFAVDEGGKPIFSWVVSVLWLIPRAIVSTMSDVPYVGDKPVCECIRQNEPWNSPHNMAILERCQNALLLSRGRCGITWDAYWDSNYCGTDYLPVIGPGTIWRSKGTVKRSDLPDGGSHTVALVEVADSNDNGWARPFAHWAEPYALAVDEAVERIETGKGVRISSYHPDGGIHVLFADGTVRCFPAQMPVSVWRKVLAGELRADELDALESTFPVGKTCTFVWVISVALLLRYAVKYRIGPDATIQSPNVRENKPATDN
jgi:hypothetical protein